MNSIRNLYGKTIIDSTDSIELNENYKVELEYYQIKNDTLNKPYGIAVIKRDIQNNEEIEEKEIKNISYIEDETNKLLEILLKNKVSPISVSDVIRDLRLKEVI